MDGGRRVLGSVRESLAAALPLASFSSAQPVAAGSSSAAFQPAPVNAVAAPPRARRRAASGRLGRLAIVTRPGFGSLVTLLIFAIVGLAGLLQSGGYVDLVARYGEPWDMAARAVGFPISAVTITGQSRLREREILAAAGVGDRDSLPFLDANAVRDRLIAIPLVKSARVMKLYPNRLVIAIEERQPYALWQRDGQLSVISEDGVAIEELRDERFLGLPFVVGAGAEKRLRDYAQLLKIAGDLAPRIKAGVFVAGRRWNLDLADGVTIKLPEEGPGFALASLMRLHREARLLDKDIMSVDLRTPGRVSIRLTEEAAAVRDASAPKKSHKSGG